MADTDTLQMFIEIVIFLPFIIFLIYLLGKFGGGKLQKMQNGRYMKILDRMPVSKENSILITKIGDKGYIISSTQSRIEILKELSEHELKEIEKESNNAYENLNLREIMSKLKIKKEDK